MQAGAAPLHPPPQYKTLIGSFTTRIRHPCLKNLCAPLALFTRITISAKASFLMFFYAAVLERGKEEEGGGGTHIPLIHHTGGLQPDFC